MNSLMQNYTHIHTNCVIKQHFSTCGLEAWEAFSCSSSASPILSTTALALSISAQAKDFSWLTKFLASSEAYRTKMDSDIIFFFSQKNLNGRTRKLKLFKKSMEKE